MELIVLVIVTIALTRHVKYLKVTVLMVVTLNSVVLNAQKQVITGFYFSIILPSP